MPVLSNSTDPTDTASLPLHGIVGSGADVAGAQLGEIVSHLQKASGLPRAGFAGMEAVRHAGRERADSEIQSLVQRLTSDKQKLMEEVRLQLQHLQRLCFIAFMADSFSQTDLSCVAGRLKCRRRTWQGSGTSSTSAL